jgi:hypothetical protein
MESYSKSDFNALNGLQCLFDPKVSVEEVLEKALSRIDTLEKALSRIDAFDRRIRRLELELY